MFFESNINNISDFFTFLNNSFVSANWKVKRYVTETNKFELVVKTNNFYIGFKSLISVTDNVYNVEFNVFKDFNSELSIHNQFACIPVKNYGSMQYYNHYAPQLCIANSLTYCKMYLKITDNYVLSAYDPKGDNSFRGGFYAGEYQSYSDKIVNDNNLIALGSSHGIYQNTGMSTYSRFNVEDVSCSIHSSIHYTNMPAWLCMRSNLTETANDFVMDSEGRWNIIRIDNNANTMDNGDLLASYESFNRNYNIIPNAYNLKVNRGYNLSDIYKTKFCIMSNPSELTKASLINDRFLTGELHDLYLARSGTSLINQQVYNIDGKEYLCIKVGNLPSQIENKFIYFIEK